MIHPHTAVINPFDEVEKEDDPQLKASYISKILLNPGFNIESMGNLEFHEKLNYPGVIKETAFALMDILQPQYDRKMKQGYKLGLNKWRECIAEILQEIDKSLFLMLKNQELTVDQVQAKIDYKKHGTVYKVLDDLRDRMDPEIAN